MGGLIEPPAEGLPNWGHEMDYNVQQDTMAARVVFDGCDPIIVPMDVTLRAWLRRAHLAELRGGGQLASLVASQAELHASDHKMAELASTWRALPDDLLNFMHDPLACAIACGWEGAELRSIGLRYAVRDGLGRFEPDASGKRTQVCRGLDGPRFEKLLISTVTAEPATPRPSPCS